MSDQSAKRDPRAEFLRKPTPLEWLVVAGIILVIYVLCFMPEMDTGTAEWQRIKEQQRQIKSGQNESPDVQTHKPDSPSDSH